MRGAGVFQIRRQSAGEGPMPPPGPWQIYGRAKTLADAEEAIRVLKANSQWTWFDVHCDPAEVEALLSSLRGGK